MAITSFGDNFKTALKESYKIMRKSNTMESIFKDIDLIYKNE